MTTDANWRIFRNDDSIRGDEKFPAPPPWRRFGGQPGAEQKRARFIFEEHEIDLINAALYLRRPLLITGKPGVGKSSLIYAVARELQLGRPLIWPINTRSTLEQGLFRYDAIGRLQELEALRSRWTRREESPAEDEDESPDMLAKFISLGPLGTAFIPSERPRALLIDEIDKSDIDLPNDLLNLFEEGWFEIPVLVRVRHKWPTIQIRPDDDGPPVPITGGRVQVTQFPFVVMTSNGERDFPQAFLRRCIRMHIKEPDAEKLGRIVREHFDEETRVRAEELINDFNVRMHRGDNATDQLLHAIFLATKFSVDLDARHDPQRDPAKTLRELLFRDLRS